MKTKIYLSLLFVFLNSVSFADKITNPYEQVIAYCNDNEKNIDKSKFDFYEDKLAMKTEEYKWGSFKRKKIEPFNPESEIAKLSQFPQNKSATSSIINMSNLGSCFEHDSSPFISATDTLNKNNEMDYHKLVMCKNSDGKFAFFDFSNKTMRQITPSHELCDEVAINKGYVFCLQLTNKTNKKYKATEAFDLKKSTEYNNLCETVTNSDNHKESANPVLK